MSNLTDIVARTKVLEKKYDKYLIQDKPKAKALAKKGDRFDQQIEELEHDAQDIAEEAMGVPQLKDRALVAQKNADIRKRKQALLAELPQLKTIIKKGKVTQEMVVARQERIRLLEEGVVAIPDGLNIARKKPGALQPKRPMFGGLGSTSRQHTDVQVDLSQVNGDDEHYMETEENKQFRQEFEQRKAAQDEHLEFIEKGLGNLQNIAQDMGTEVSKQDVLIDEIEKGLDKGTKSVETNNQKLAGVLTRVRSQRNFCIDIILVIILLAVAGYIYTLFA
eukprot:jgi/Ulvmu1/12050/UM083_0063.1